MGHLHDVKAAHLALQRRLDQGRERDIIETCQGHILRHAQPPRFEGFQYPQRQHVRDGENGAWRLLQSHQPLCTFLPGRHVKTAHAHGQFLFYLYACLLQGAPVSQVHQPHVL